jgi:nitronate monooxygenase
MHVNGLPALTIGNLSICPPIIQGGMGVRVSRANLAAAAANTGCMGVIASAGIGQFEDSPGSEFAQLNESALRCEIRKARTLSTGPIGVNIMAALTDYDNLVRVAVEENVDAIISGAGLPLNLPGFLKGRDIKLIPVVSSARTLSIICRKWQNHFDRLPDAVIVEGPRAGGHLGYSHRSINENTAPALSDIIPEVLQVAGSFGPAIPVIAAGGIFDGSDIARFLRLGASGVQMATRFVCTDECDAHDNFKQAYLNCTADEITIIESPVGLPGRVITNSFVERVKQGKKTPFACKYKCLRTCEPKQAPYCIARTLANAAQGRLEESFVFAGSNAYRCTEIVSVKTLVEQLSDELSLALAAEIAGSR